MVGLFNHQQQAVAFYSPSVDSSDPDLLFQLALLVKNHALCLKVYFGLTLRGEFSCHAQKIHLTVLDEPEVKLFSGETFEKQGQPFYLLHVGISGL